MVRKWPGFGEPELEKPAPRGVEPSPAAPRPGERKLGAVAANGKRQGGELQTDAKDHSAIWPDERALDLDSAQVEGWVAGVPVVDGVADSGWRECQGGRVRLVVTVADSAEQREWVRAMMYGGAYAREVMG